MKKNLFLCLSLNLAFLLPTFAAETKTASVAKQQAEIKFAGAKFIRRTVKVGKSAFTNSYFLEKQNPTNWSHRISMLIYPKLNDPTKQVNAIASLLKKNNIPHEILKTNLAGTAAISFTEHHPKFSSYALFFFHPTKDGKMLIARQFTFRASSDKKEAFSALIKKQQANWLKALPAITFPAFEFPPKQSAQTPPKLKMVKESVDDIQKSGKLVRIDANFSRKFGGDKSPPRPFSIRLPEGKHIYVIGAPKVPETARITFATDDGKNFMESIRFMTFGATTKAPMEKRLNAAINIMRQQYISKLKEAYKDVKVTKQYRTKIGPNDAAVILLIMKDKKDDRLYFSKLVAILDETHPEGVAALLTFTPVGEPNEVFKKRLNNGKAQQVLHSLRFLPSK